MKQPARMPANQIRRGSVAPAVQPGSGQATAANSLSSSGSGDEDFGTITIPPNYPFADEDKPSNIRLNAVGNITYSTSEKLIERLTYEKVSHACMQPFFKIQNLIIIFPPLLLLLLLLLLCVYLVISL